MNWKTVQLHGNRAAQEAGAQVYRLNGLTADVYSLAISLGIDRIQEHEIPTTAILIARADGKYTVSLKKDMPTARQRFSLAHEIGHLLLRPLLGGSIQHWARLDPTHDFEGQRIERLCDQMAAEMLMPESLFSSWMNSKSWTAFALTEASEEFSVSLETAARRFVEMRAGRPIFTRWNVNSRGAVNLTRAPIAPQVKNLRALEFVTIGKQPSMEMQTTYKNAVQTTTRETVRLIFGRSAQSRQCLVESICHGNGQWREVYSFVYPEQTPPGQVHYALNP